MPPLSLQDAPETAAAKIREYLGIDLYTQFAWQSEKEAFGKWETALEKRGLITFQLPFPFEEARAFSLADERFPAVVLNLRDSTTGRIFSLFHELAHLLLNEVGICDIGDASILSPEEARVETYCNRLAADILVPEDALLNQPSVASVAGPSEWEDPPLADLARLFKVSKEVILRRLLSFGRTTEAFYERKRAEWQEKAKERARRKGGRKLPPARHCVRENGVAFVSLVLSAYQRGDVSCADVVDYLGIRLKYIPAVEQLAGRAY